MTYNPCDQVATRKADDSAASNDEILDPEALARLLGVSRDTLDRRRDQLPPGYRVGRRTLWLKSAVLAHIGRA
jgi:predicted DNA-binding transcriptional regulator AlpA